MAGTTLEEIISQCVLVAMDLSDAQMSGPAELCVVLSNDAEQQALNKKWRRQDKPTNVLSFAQAEPFVPVGGLLGDIVLAYETVARQALKQQKTFCNHLSHLVVHGFLHILGYDHQTGMEADRMEGLEVRVLAHLKISNPYI